MQRGPEQWAKVKHLFDELLVHSLALAKKGLGTACVSITLCHAFGMGSAVGSALRRGAAVVLPAVGGIRGCGDPTQRASVTLDVLEATGASVLFADSHTLKALPEREGGALPKLRTGVVKIGSGSDFLDVTHAVIGGAERPLEYAGTKLLAMGKRA